MDSTTVKNWLTYYVDALKWHIIPCHGTIPDWPAPGNEACGCPKGIGCKEGQRGKHPIKKYKFPERTIEYRPYTIDQLHLAHDTYQVYHRGACPTWGLLLGESNVVCIDVDHHRGGPNGHESFAAMVRNHGLLPATPRDSRHHYYFRAPIALAGILTSKIDLAPGLELKGGASLAHIPPSRHRSAAYYEWLPGLSPHDVALAELPTWMVEIALDLLKKPERTHAEKSHTTTSGESRANQWTPIERAKAWLLKSEPAIEGRGGRQHTLKTTKTVVMGFDLSTAEAMEAFRDWNAGNDPPWEDRELYEIIDSAQYLSGERGRLLSEDRRSPAGPTLVDGCATDQAGLDLAAFPVRPPAEIAADLAECPHGCHGEHDQPTEQTPEQTELATAADRLIRSLETTSRRPEPITCKCHGFLYHPERKQVRAAMFACGRWCCVRCAVRLKDIWAPHLEHKVKTSSTSNTSPSPETQFPEIHTARRPLSKREWNAIRRQLHRRGAEFARVCIGYEYLIVATAAFSGSTISPSHEAAGDLVAQTIRNLSIFGDTKKPIHTSAGWRLPKDKPSGWRRVGALPKNAKKSEIVNAMEAEGLDPQQKKRKHPFFVWSADASFNIPPDVAAEHNWGSAVRDLYTRINFRLEGVDPDLAMVACDIHLPINSPLVE